MANFSTVERVQQTIRMGDPVERVRQENRIKVTDAANCVPPLSKEEARKLGLKINVNWGGLMILLSHARRQYLTAFHSSQHFFTVKLPYAPRETQSEWEGFITEEINKPMRESITYFEHHRSRWSSVVTHGVGAMVWPDPDRWEPNFLAMCDLRIPTDTTLDFKNLTWYAARHPYTPYELIDEAFAPGDNNRWNKRAIADIVKNYKEVNFVEASQNYDWENSPEKLAELVKQDGGYYSGDAMPSIPLWHFYFEDNSDPDNCGWFMRVVPESGVVRGAESKEFLWTSDEPVAAERQQLMQCQFGDLSTDAPFKYHSVRSLGYALLEPEFYDNLTKCRLLQHINDNFNIWLRTTDPADKARPQVQEFSNLGLLRTGLTVVPRDERHQVDSALVEMGLAQLQQLKQQASSTYTQQIDTGTRKEQTAFETSVKVQQVNAMLGGLLLTAFRYASVEYREQCRRYCRPNSKDPAIQLFQKRCRQAGIPRRHLDVKLWVVEPVTPLGMGNPTMAQAASQQLMAMRAAFEPSAQQEILHEATQVITGDPRKAARWAPVGAVKDVPRGEEYAASIFGTLMQAVPVRPVERISSMEQLDALIPMMGTKINLIKQRDNVGRPEEVLGLQTVYQYIVNLVQKLAEDDQQKDRVREYMDQGAKLWNEVKGLAQRSAEMARKRATQGGNGEVDQSAMAKVQATKMMADVKAQTTLAKAKLNEKLKEQQHIRQQRREDAHAFAEMQREEIKTRAKARMQSTQE